MTHDGVAISHIFYVLLKSADDFEKLTGLADEIGCRILGHSNWNENLIKLATSTESKFRSLGACRYIMENGDFEFADPCFLVEDRPLYSPTDPLYFEQWSLNSPQAAEKGINIAPAWEITRGSSSVNLAIFDYGFDSNNPDFASHLHSAMVLKIQFRARAQNGIMEIWSHQ